MGLAFPPHGGRADGCQLWSWEMECGFGGRQVLFGAGVCGEADSSLTLGRERLNLKVDKGKRRCPLPAWVLGLSGGASGFLRPVPGFILSSHSCLILYLLFELKAHFNKFHPIKFLHVIE